MTHLAEYTVDEIGSNGLPMSKTHGQFVGYVTSADRAVAIPQRNTLTVDMEAVAKMQAEREECLNRMENGGSYWS